MKPKTKGIGMVQSKIKVGNIEDIDDVYWEFADSPQNRGWNVTFTSRKQARLAAALMFKETIVKGPHKA